MITAAREIIWIKLPKESKFGEITEMELVYDNEVALHIALNRVFHERDQTHRLITILIDKELSGDNVIEFVRSKNQL